MRVLFAHAGSPHPKAVAALERFAPQAEIVDVSHSKWAYWEEIASRWTGTDDLVTIEHDIEIFEGTIESFDECPEPWCVYGYGAPGIFAFRLEKSLGCTRFRKELQRKVSTAEIAAASLTIWPGHKVSSEPRIVWDRIDWRISSHLIDHGYNSHVHGTVTHYHAYPNVAVNARVDKAIQDYLDACAEGLDENTIKFCYDTAIATLRLANSGEINVDIDAPAVLFYE